MEWSVQIGVGNLLVILDSETLVAYAAASAEILINSTTRTHTYMRV